MLEKLSAIAREAGELIAAAEDREKEVGEKSFSFDLVTDYDRAVQKLLKKRLQTLLPEAGFWGEEGMPEEQADSAWRFVVDPIDGTTNFVKNLHMSCVSIGLVKDGNMEYGVIYDPYADELFCAQRGKGAFLNGQRLQLPEVASEKPVTIMGMSPYYRQQYQNATFLMMEKLFEKSVDVRVTGSAALDFCFLAAGRADYFAEYCMSPWDCAAGSLIAQEAGCTVTDMAGAPLQFAEKTSVLVSHPQLHDTLLQLAREVGTY